ncbi:MAG: hypothetical protein OEM66_01155 [Acidimicrobiia bacterium]|nr:hypothetical protein [Acidimicrobiia bacterium]
MKFSVESWAPEYGVPAQTTEAAQPADAFVEVDMDSWGPMLPDVDPAGEVLFVDGVRRVDANVWIEVPGRAAALGLCAVYAAGAVLCNETAQVVESAVDRGLFTSAPGAEDLVTAHGVYAVRATPGGTPEELWLGIQQRMGELEGRVAAAWSGSAVVVVDGPLSHRRHVAGAVGYIKTQHVQYLPDHLHSTLSGLAAGRRTPLFLIGGGWSRYSWYARLAVGESPLSGIVRCEITADHAIGEAARIADRMTATLPRYSSDAHKDARAPQNLYPIGGLERALRRRLGDPQLMFRALRVASRG